MEQDWLWGLAGGVMIGTAAALFLLMNGRVMGASGIIGGLIDGSGRGNARERLAFLAALIIVPGTIALWTAPATHLTSNWVVIIVAGVLVGIGTRLANGCTSGHGVCGISRLSVRGIVATLIYVGAGGAIMALARHAWGLI